MNYGWRDDLLARVDADPALRAILAEELGAPVPPDAVPPDTLAPDHR